MRNSEIGIIAISPAIGAVAGLITAGLHQLVLPLHEWALGLAQARYKAAISSLVELTDARLSATSAAIAEANARFSTLIQRAILDYQTCSLRRDPAGTAGPAQAARGSLTRKQLPLPGALSTSTSPRFA